MGIYVLHKGDEVEEFKDEFKLINAYDYAIKKEAQKIDPYLETSFSEGQYYKMFTNVWPEEKAHRNLKNSRDKTTEYIDYIVRIEINDNAINAAKRATKNRKERNRYHLNKQKDAARVPQITPDEFFC